MTKNIHYFNIRVYGLVIRDGEFVLLSDEFRMDRLMTKFPGGGLKFGEGPEDCIQREAREEFGQEVDIIDHFYTTGFFQKALFFENHQLISIYYRIAFKENIQFKISEKKFDFGKKINGKQSFRWAFIDELQEEDLSFPVDQYVVKLLKEEFPAT